MKSLNWRRTGSTARSLSTSSIALGVALSSFLGACVSPPVEAPQTTVEQQTNISTAQTVKNKVDLLFMIDDSASMAVKQNALKSKFSTLIDAINGFSQKADYHIGVVTSDVTAPGLAGCGHNLNGQLQKKGQATENDPNCQGPSGNFIDYNLIDNTNNLPNGQDLATTFSCMATVVDSDTKLMSGGWYGCGFEEQINATYMALHDNIPANTGFLRPDAILAVVYITDEDDCSLDTNTDLLQASSAKYGPLNSYRCAQYGIYCDGMLLPYQPQASFNNCSPATPAQGGKLTDLNKFVNFFLKPSSQGGVKDDPNDVILAAITAPATPVGSFSATGTPNCGNKDSAPFNGPCTNISHSCVSATDSSFFGDPSQRLSSFVGQAQNKSITSICDADYTPALQAIAKLIVGALQPSCLTAPIKTIPDKITGATRPDCIVEDTTPSTTTSLPFCDDAPGTLPCWKEQDNAQCPYLCDPSMTPGKLVQPGITIQRDPNVNNGKAPDGTVAKISCSTIALANQDPYAACGGCPDGGNCSSDGGV